MALTDKEREKIKKIINKAVNDLNTIGTVSEIEYHYLRPVYPPEYEQLVNKNYVTIKFYEDNKIFNYIYNYEITLKNI